MMFILVFSGAYLFVKQWFVFISNIGEYSNANAMYRSPSFSFVDISLYSISFSILIGIVLGCMFSLLWSKYKTQGLSLAHSKALNALVESKENSTSISKWSFDNNCYLSYREKHITTRCDVLNTIAEQVKFMRSLKTDVTLFHYGLRDYSLVLPICPLWFSSVIRELLVNAVKHNQKKKAVKIEVSTSLQDGIFIVCITDNGVGLSSNITNKLGAIKIAKDAGLSTSLFGHEESINLACIKGRLQQLNGLLDVVSAKHFLTKVTLQIPYLKQVKHIHSDDQKIPYDTDEASLNSHLQTLLLITKQNKAQLSKLQLLTERFNLILATSVEEGIALVLHKEVDCILFDSKQSEILNVDTQSWLEQNTELADIPMVILENQTDHSSQLKVMQLGIAAVIAKSTRVSEIANIIDKVICEKQRVLHQVSEGIANYHLRLASANNINEQEDIKFLESFAIVLQENYTKENFNRPEAATMMLMTQKTLARRLNQHYKLGFTEKLRQFRLHVAKDLLISGTNVTTATYNTGFNSPSYFAQCFRSEFGFPPSMLCKTQPT